MKTHSPLTLIMITLLLTGAGFGAGFFLAPRETISPLVTTQATTKTILRGDTTALTLAQSEIAALKTECDNLRKQLAAQESAATLPPSETNTTTPVVEERRLSPRERMEELKKTDPERYAEMEKRRAEFQQRMADARDARNSFLETIDLSLMTPEQQAVHARYTEALAQQESLQEQMREKFEAGEEPTEADREQMRASFEEMRELRQQEREALFGAMGTSMGLTSDESVELSALIQEIYDATSRGGMMRMGPPPSARGPDAGNQPPPPMP